MKVSIVAGITSPYLLATVRAVAAAEAVVHCIAVLAATISEPMHAPT